MMLVRLYMKHILQNREPFTFSLIVVWKYLSTVLKTLFEMFLMCGVFIPISNIIIYWSSLTEIIQFTSHRGAENVTSQLQSTVHEYFIICIISSVIWTFSIMIYYYRVREQYNNDQLKGIHKLFRWPKY